MTEHALPFEGAFPDRRAFLRRRIAGRMRGPLGPGFGFGFGFEGGPRRHGPRARRGDVRAGVLLLLAEEPRNGYAIMQEIERRTDGVWRPSPGAVYPALSQLEDEGLVRAVEQDRRRSYELTGEGREYVETRREELRAPWDAVNEGVDDVAWQYLQRGRALGLVSLQLLQAGVPAQLEKASQVLDDARRALYRILADEDDETPPPAEAGDA
jgi:DNA-binding PadR family transcriptional regulator